MLLKDWPYQKKWEIASECTGYTIIGVFYRLESNYDSALYYFQRVVNFHQGQGHSERSLQALFNMEVITVFRFYTKKPGAIYKGFENYRNRR